MNIKHAVIDGSNIATEGRDAPSLAQLDEAVSAFIDEYAPEIVTVVVDATFPNRIAAGERKAYEAAVAANELTTPPAGAIGRGDGFVLQIARRVQATILSNDSFQEFHGQYPWLFEKGRLIGGKPVPHVGWVFMERAPVRGPTSRRAVSEARKEAKADKAAPASSASSVDADAAAGVPDGGGVDAAPAPASGRRSRRMSPPKVSADATPVVDAVVSGNGASAASASSGVAGSAGDAGAAGGDGADGPSGGRRRRAASVDKAALSESHNDLLPFLDFVQAHPVGTEVDATIEKFSSHGAYALVGEVRAYVPLRYLADPAPRSAKEVVALGETRSLLVVSIDPPRRGVDLGIPGVADVDAIPVEASTLVEEAKAAAGIESSTEVEAPATTADKPARRSRKRAAPEGEAAEAEATDATGEPAPAKKASRRTGKATAEAGPGEAAPAKRTHKRASTTAQDATSDDSAPAPAPAPAKRTRKRTSATAPEPMAAEAPPAPLSAQDAPPAAPEAEPAPAPAKRTRKRTSAPAAVESLPAPGTPSPPTAGSSDAPPAPTKRSRKRATPQAEAGPEPVADAPAPTDAPAPAKRTRKRTPAPSADGAGSADAPAAGPASAPAKRTRKRATAATTSDT